MPSAKLAVVSSLAAVALAGCGAINVKPVASTGSSNLVSRGKIDDPRTTAHNHLQCLQQQHFAVQEVGATGLQIGTAPAGPSVVFEPSPGAAQSMQIEGGNPGAEVIGSALLYPHQATDGQLEQVEACLAQGVSG
jgi:hypothetical protein